MLINKLLTLTTTCILLLVSNSSIARFTQADTWKGIELQPHTLNKYSYVHNDPANLIDPSGNIASLGGLMSALSSRSTVSAASHASYRVTLRKVGRELSCIAIEEIVSDLIIQQLTGGVYVFMDSIAPSNPQPYIGSTNDFNRRIQEHARSSTKKVEKVLAMFHMDGNRNDLRVVEQFFMDLFTQAGQQTTNRKNAIATNPASFNSQKLRRMVDQLDFCK